MDVRGSLGAVAVGLLLVVGAIAGFYATNGQDSESMQTQNVSVKACDALPDYDYGRMLSRVEEIKGTQMQRNLTLCTERSSTGIDTTPNEGQFALIEQPGLAFFGLNANVSSKRRSALGHTEFSPSSGRVTIFLANESVVKSVPWISYEGLVTHEMSDAIEATVAVSGNATANRQATAPRTTDAILARQAFSNGVSLYVSDQYVRQYGGHLNVSALSATEQNWKRRVGQSMYYSGYRYAEQTGQRTVHETTLPSFTAQILHPNGTRSVTGELARPNLSVDSLEHVRTDRIGELFVRATFRSKGVSATRAAAAADGWTNDRMDYFRANGSTVISWRVTWENTHERTEFVGTYDSMYQYERVNSLRSVSCDVPGRYLAISKKTVTAVQCGS